MPRTGYLVQTPPLTRTHGECPWTPFKPVLHKDARITAQLTRTCPRRIYSCGGYTHWFDFLDLANYCYSFVFCCCSIFRPLPNVCSLGLEFLALLVPTPQHPTSPSNSGCNHIHVRPGWAGTAIRSPDQNLCPVAHASRFSDGPPFSFPGCKHAPPPLEYLSASLHEEARGVGNPGRA